MTTVNPGKGRKGGKGRQSGKGRQGGKQRGEEGERERSRSDNRCTAVRLQFFVYAMPFAPHTRPTNNDVLNHLEFIKAHLGKPSVVDKVLDTTSDDIVVLFATLGNVVQKKHVKRYATMYFLIELFITLDVCIVFLSLQLDLDDRQTNDITIDETIPPYFEYATYRILIQI